MDAIQLLEEMGDVPPAVDCIIDATVQQVLAAAHQEANASSAIPRVSPRRRLRRPLVLGAAGGACTVAAVIAALALMPAGGGTGKPTERVQGPKVGHHPLPVLTAEVVRLISAQSEAATADSGTAVETTTNSTGSAVSGDVTQTDVTFSGRNVNYLVVGNGDGAGGVQNRVVDGQVYLYIKGPDLQMHWYHDTAPDAAVSLSFPDPRSLLQAVSPLAGLVNVGRDMVGGEQLTHLRATTPGSIGMLGLPDVSRTVTAFDVWVDSADVVRQMSVSSSDGGTGLMCAASGKAHDTSSGDSSSGRSRVATIPPGDRISTLPDGKAVPPGVVCGMVPSGQTVSTLSIQFGNLGATEVVTAPTGAIDQAGLG